MSKDVEEALADLAREYRDDLPRRLANIRAAIEHVRAHPTDASAWFDARNLVHRLHGTAGSFGFRELGDAAAQLEEILVRALDDEGRRDDDAWRMIAALLELIHERAGLEGAGRRS